MHHILKGETIRFTPAINVVISAVAINIFFVARRFYDHVG